MAAIATIAERSGTTDSATEDVDENGDDPKHEQSDNDNHDDCHDLAPFLAHTGVPLALNRRCADRSFFQRVHHICRAERIIGDLFQAEVLDYEFWDDHSWLAGLVGSISILYGI